MLLLVLLMGWVRGVDAGGCRRTGDRRSSAWTRCSGHGLSMCYRPGAVRGAVHIAIAIRRASSVHARLFLRLFLGCLTGRSGLELASNGLQVVWHLRVGLQKEQFQVSSLVFELDLGPILQDILDRPVWTKKLEDLAPMWALHHVETCHQRLLFLGGPWSSSRLQAFPSSTR